EGERKGASYSFYPSSPPPLVGEGAGGRGFSSPLFEAADLVTDAGRLLVVLAGDGLLEAVSQLGPLGLRPPALTAPPGGLAAVLGLAVDVLQQRGQFVAELLVVVGAPEPAGVAELGELHAAQGALVLVEQALFRLVNVLADGGLRAALLLGLVQILIG